MNWEQEKYNRHLEHSQGDCAELEDWIREGEHQRQDFKFRIDSSVKIARSLSAFANCEGGQLLIGVKDNGRIAGVDPEEEYFMIEGAAELYCDPPVAFSAQVYDCEEGKLVLVVSIPRSAQAPHFVKEEGPRKVAYLRRADQNIAGNRVLLRFLRGHEANAQAPKNLVAYGPAERLLFDYLSEHPHLSLSKFARMANISHFEAERILCSFLHWEVIDWLPSEGGIRFALKAESN